MVLPEIPQARDSEALRSLIDVVKPGVLIEFGSWEGRSALAFAQRASETELPTEIVCVDTWLGSPEHWRNDFPDSEWSFEHLKIVGGEPRVLDTFRQAMRYHGVEDRVSILRATTTLASIYLLRIGKLADLVYVDAEHSFRAVRSDLQIASTILRDGGVIAGDDFVWSSVQMAVISFSGNRWNIFKSEDGLTYVLVKKNQTSLARNLESAKWAKVGKFRFVFDQAPRVFRRAVKTFMHAMDGAYLKLGLGRFSPR